MVDGIKKTITKVEKIFEDIKNLTLPEVGELVEKTKTEFKVGEAVVMSQGATPTPEEKKEEKGGNVSVRIVKINETGLNKIKIYGNIKDFINEIEGENINIVQAKKRAEEGDKIILNSVSSEKAKIFKKQLEGKVEIEIK
jgi:ribosomal protein L7/L12